MKHLIAAMLITGLASTCLVGCSGANDAKSTQETTISTPGGTTKITIQKEVETTGDNPPVKP